MVANIATPAAISVEPVETLTNLRGALVSLVSVQSKVEEVESAALVATYGMALACSEMIVKRWAKEVQTTPKAVWSDVWKMTLKTLAFDGFAIYRGEDCATLAVRISKTKSHESRMALVNEMLDLSAKDVVEGLAKVRKVARPAFEQLATNHAAELKAIAKLSGAKMDKAWRDLFASRWGTKNEKGKAVPLNWTRLAFAVEHGTGATKAEMTPADFAARVNKRVDKMTDIVALEAMKAAIQSRLDELVPAIARATAAINGTAERDAENAKLAKAVKAAKPAKVAKPRAPRASKAEKAIAAKIDTDSAALADAMAA